MILESMRHSCHTSVNILVCKQTIVFSVDAEMGGGKVWVEPPGRSQAASGNMTPACHQRALCALHTTTLGFLCICIFPSKNVTNMENFAFLLWPFWEKTFILSRKGDETLEQQVVASGRRDTNPLFSYLCRCSADFESWIWSKDVPLVFGHCLMVKVL